MLHLEPYLPPSGLAQPCPLPPALDKGQTAHVTLSFHSSLRAPIISYAFHNNAKGVHLTSGHTGSRGALQPLKEALPNTPFITVTAVPKEYSHSRHACHHAGPSPVTFASALKFFEGHWDSPSMSQRGGGSQALPLSQAMKLVSPRTRVPAADRSSSFQHGTPLLPSAICL